MELFETQKQKTITSENICESCAYVVFDSPDYDYSCEGEYVDDCMYDSHHSDFVDKVIDEMFDPKTQIIRSYCPFWLPRFSTEVELLRCPSCNSPEWEDIPGSVDSKAMTEKLKCMHCGETRAEDIRKVAYSSGPHNEGYLEEFK